MAQEIALVRPIARDVPLSGATYGESIALEPYATTCLWITPVLDDAPATPAWLEARVEEGNVVLRWRANREPWFYGYEMWLVRDGVPAERISPEPLRAALWIDTAPPVGRRSYAVRAVGASGVASAFAVTPAVEVGA
jgi:hypothetical protein